VLAVLIVAFSPNYGIEKYGPSAVVPAFLLVILGAWLLWQERTALFAVPAARRWLTVFALLYLPILVSVPGSLNRPLSATIAAVLPLYFLAGLALLRVLADDERRGRFSHWVAIVILLWAIDGLIQYLAGVDLFGVRVGPQNRVIGPFEGNVRLPVFLVLLAPLAVAVLASRRVALGWAGFALLGVVAMLNGSRTILPWLVVWLPRSRSTWLALAVLVVSAGAVVALSPALKYKLAMFGHLDALGFESIDRVLSFRLTIWDAALNMLHDRPFTGVGAGAFASAYAGYSTRPDDFFLANAISPYHAHNLYAGVAAETGWTGLLALCAIVVLGVRWYRQAPAARRTLAWPFVLALLVYVFPINSQPVLFTHWMFPVVLLLLCGMLAALDMRPAGTGPAARV
jgi:O-antigen ligase